MLMCLEIPRRIRSKNEASEGKCRNLQFLEWPLEAGSKSESIFIYAYIQKSNFTSLKIIFKFGVKKGFTASNYLCFFCHWSF